MRVQLLQSVLGGSSVRVVAFLFLPQRHLQYSVVVDDDVVVVVVVVDDVDIVVVVLLQF